MYVIVVGLRLLRALAFWLSGYMTGELDQQLVTGNVLLSTYCRVAVLRACCLGGVCGQCGLWSVVAVVLFASSKSQSKTPWGIFVCISARLFHLFKVEFHF